METTKRMKYQIAKLMCEYEAKIVQCDVMLDDIKKANTKARHDYIKVAMREYQVDRVLWDARKQAYIQAKTDFDSLLDFC